MKILTASSAHASPDLFLLGVPETAHDKSPNAGLFPDNLNSELKRDWDKMFSDPVFQTRLAGCATNEQRWALAIQAHLGNARAKDVTPFQPHILDTDNGRIGSAISAHRQNIHSELVKARLVELSFRSATPSVNRRKTGGFTLSVRCKAKIPKGHEFCNIDKLVKHLGKHGYHQEKSGVFLKPLNPESSIRLDTRRDTILSYDICSSTHPYIKSWSMVTKAKYNNFVVSRIWKPLIKSAPNNFSRYGL